MVKFSAIAGLQSSLRILSSVLLHLWPSAFATSAYDTPLFFSHALHKAAKRFPSFFGTKIPPLNRTYRIQPRIFVKHIAFSANIFLNIYTFL